ncbi:MAG: NIPSNAP family protein [Acidimicrobiales bacterium]
MLHQLRTYQLFAENKGAFHSRFDEHAWRIMQRHGFKILAFWEAEEDGGPVFVYLLVWPDEATMASAWEAFMGDQEWSDIKATTSAEHGRMVGWIRDHKLEPTSYSPEL